MDILDSKKYEAILSHLHRTEAFAGRKDPIEDNTLGNLKRFELMLRCGLVPRCSYNDLSKFSKKYLLLLRAAYTEELRTEERQALSDSIVQALEGVAHSVKESMVGPYRIIFCQMKEPVAFGPINPEPDIRTLAKHFTAIEMADDAVELSADWRIRSACLAALRIRSVKIPFADWKLLRGNITAQHIYLTTLLQAEK